jgi:outer membrane lipoprotein-sorting protein
MRYLAALLLFCSTGFSQSVNNAEQLITAMHARYNKIWYKTVTFTQKTVNHLPDGTTKEETWYEAAKLPVGLRIDFAPVDSGNGILFVRDSIFVFEKGQRQNARALIHPLMLLGFDVYALPVEVTMEKLKTLKFDLSKFHQAIWQGRAVFVVGAEKGDERSKQFWIDKERLIFVRSLETSPRDSTIVMETQFNKYQKLAGGWIETEVHFYRDGKLATEELYSDIKGEVRLDDKLFDPAYWKTARWRK